MRNINQCVLYMVQELTQHLSSENCNVWVKEYEKITQKDVRWMHVYLVTVFVDFFIIDRASDRGNHLQLFCFDVEHVLDLYINRAVYFRNLCPRVEVIRRDCNRVRRSLLASFLRVRKDHAMRCPGGVDDFCQRVGIVL
jgi:predicted nucleotidyltransferase